MADVDLTSLPPRAIAPGKVDEEGELRLRMAKLKGLVVDTYIGMYTKENPDGALPAKDCPVRTTAAIAAVHKMIGEASGHTVNLNILSVRLPDKQPQEREVIDVTPGDPDADS